MKQIILSIFIIISSNINSQCLDLNFLNSLFLKDLETQESSLTKLNYQVYQDKYNFCTNNDRTCLDFHKESDDSFINIIKMRSNMKTIGVEYRIKSKMDCYEKIKVEAKSLGFNKDYETNKSNSFYYFYSNGKSGILFSKWKMNSTSEGYNYSIKILSKEAYLKEKDLYK